MLHENFIFIGPSGTRSKDATFNWVSSTPDLQMTDTEVLYENDEVPVDFHNVVGSGGRGTGKALCFTRVKDEKLSYWRVHLLPISN